MAYGHHRVHPLDYQAAMDSQRQQNSKYVRLDSTTSTGLRPPPMRRNIPRYHSSHHRSGGNCCLRCVCCCFCFWILLIVLLATALALLYTFLQPQVPIYGIDRFNVNAFTLQPDFSLYAEFVVTVKAKNPNERIGIIYGKGSSVVVFYNGSSLCSGKLPAYHQPSKNVTMVNVVLKGKSEFGSGLQEALMENRKGGKIPLLVAVAAPVSIVLQDFPLREIVVLVNCSLVVDNLAPNKQVKILSATYEYGIELL